MSACVCVCVSVKERERERGTEGIIREKKARGYERRVTSEERVEKVDTNSASPGCKKKLYVTVKPHI